MTVAKQGKRKDGVAKRQRKQTHCVPPPIVASATTSVAALTSPLMLAARPPPLIIPELPPIPTQQAATPKKSPAAARPPSPRGKLMSPPMQRALLADFLYREVFGIVEIKESEGSHNQQRVVNFLKSFLEIEKLILYGLCLCIDSFIYVFTYLPLRIILAVGSGVFSIFHKRSFRRSHMHDVLLAIIMTLSIVVLMQVDMSRVYHLIRGQALIKLYVLFTMLEIVDKLFCSLGQDVLDAMYFTVKFQPRRVGRMAFDFAVCSIYTSVFKKFEEQNLFQIACSDIVERFKLMLIIGLILLQSDGKDVADGTAMVLMAEMLIDWIKHAFITKFNQIPPSVYSKFTTILCRDVAGFRSDSTIQDHTQFVSRRLGLISLPLACVTVRMIHEALKDAQTIASLEGDFTFVISRPAWVCIVLLAFLCLSAFKVLLSMLLMVHACLSGRLSRSWKSAPTPGSPTNRSRSSESARSFI